MTAWQLPLLALVGLCVLFGAAYLFARKINNYGIVDIVWTYTLGLTGVFYALAGPGWSVRRLGIGALAAGWSLRLGTHVAVRVIGHHPKEDPRYTQLRHAWAGQFNAKMAGFFQLQAASVVLLAGPFLFAAFNPTPGLQPLEIIGSVLWLIAVSGEAWADAQLAAFKRSATRRGEVCDIGLWRYSRHPNYFFEWLVWVAFFVFACASPWGWLAAFSPLCILWFLLRVTGIPMTEEQSLRSKGEAYRRYQRSTSAFVPWFPKQGRSKPAP